MPNYPSYSTDLLEEYYFDYVNKHLGEHQAKDRLLIPVFWTNILCEKQPIHYEVQNYLNALDPNRKYYTVVQHDLDVVYRLPPDTKVFAAGGLSGKGIPLPLVGSSIPKNFLNPVDKEILCSGIYSMTHPIRQKLYELYKDNPNFYINRPRNWTDSIPNQDFMNFVNQSKRSWFGLAPRGNSPNSFRLYELFQLNCIPVIVTDRFYLPFSDELNWSEFSILINESEIPALENKLLNISDDKRRVLLEKGKDVWNNYFAIEKVCENIFKRI